MKYNRVLAVGVFDLFHIGHLRYLQYAFQHSEYLMVAVSSDEICFNIKNKAAVIPEDQRLEIVRGLGWVDEARLQPCSLNFPEAAVAWILDWQVDHLVIGGDWKGSERWIKLIPLLAEKGITVDFAPRTEHISTSDLVLSIKKS